MTAHGNGTGEQSLMNLGEFGRTARKRADDAKKDAVRGLNTAAEALRREARELATTPEIRSSVDDTARDLEKAATHLLRPSHQAVVQDNSLLVKGGSFRNLLMVFVAGLVVGLLLRGDDQDR